jgi:hypothetical protein
MQKFKMGISETEEEEKSIKSLIVNENEKEEKPIEK